MREAPRIDFWRVRWDAKSRLDENGFLRISGTASQVGILEYGKADGAPHDGYMEFVSPEIVADAESLASLRGLPITDDHPENMLTAANTDKYQVGSIADVRTEGSGDDTLLRIDAVITKDRVIDAVKAGKTQLSPGYYSQIDKTPGKFRGKNYDAKQGPRRYNHLAIVDQARAGESNALDARRDALGRIFRMDGLRIQRRDASMADTTDETTDENTDQEMVEVMVEGEAHKVSPAVKALIEAQASKIKSMTESKDEGDEESSDKNTDQDEGDDKEKGEKTDMVTKEYVDKAVAGIASSVVKEMVKHNDAAAKTATERAEVIHAATPCLPNSFKFDGKSIDDIRLAVIEKHDKALAVTAKADSSLIPGLFAAATAGKAKQDNTLDGARSDSRAPVKGLIAQAQENAKVRRDGISACPIAGEAALKAGDEAAKKGAA
jgi:hypothetical protein